MRLVRRDGPCVGLGEAQQCAGVGRADDLIVDCLEQGLAYAVGILVGNREIGHSGSLSGSGGRGGRPASSVRTSLCENARSIGKLADVNNGITQSFPVRFVGSFIAAIGVAIGLYLGALLSVYILGWILGLIESI
jgi:hypothetical protein